MIKCSDNSFNAWALSLSLSAHVLLVLSIGSRHIPTNGTDHPSAEGHVEVALIAPGYGPRLQKEEIDKPQQSRQQSQTTVSSKPKVPVLHSHMEKSLLDIQRPSEPYYFPVAELEEKPKVSLDVSAELALSLSNQPPQSAILRLLINESGRVDQVIDEKLMLSESARHIVVDTFSRMKFQPGQIQGEAVKSQLLIELSLDDVLQKH